MNFRPQMLHFLGLISTLLLWSCQFKEPDAPVKAALVETIDYPVVLNVTSNRTNGTYVKGQSIDIRVRFSKIVYVDTSFGTPTITLQTGLTNSTADYVSGSGSSTLVFSYVVQTGDVALDLDYQSITSLAHNLGTVRDVDGADADLTLPYPSTAGSLGHNKNFIIDGTDITVRYVRSSTPNGAYAIGQNISVEVSFSKPVLVYTTLGTPYIILNSEGATNPAESAKAHYVSGSGNNNLVFNYTITALDEVPDLNYASTSALILNGGRIVSTLGMEVSGTTVAGRKTVTLPAITSVKSLGGYKNIEIDGILPAVVRVTSTSDPDPANHGVGDIINVTVEFSEVVKVVGFPTITLETGNSEDKLATYVSGTGTKFLVFEYEVQRGDDADPLNYVTTDPLDLDSLGVIVLPTGASIKDPAGNNAILDLPSMNSGFSLAFSNIVIDTPAASVTNVTSDVPDDSYGTGKKIIIKVTFNGPVIVTGDPILHIDTGLVTTSFPANYVGSNGTDTLEFEYVVQQGDANNDLNYVDVNSLDIITNFGTTIVDAWNGKDATLTLPHPTGLDPDPDTKSLGENKNIIINHAHLTVLATYQDNGVNWNDYVKNDNPASALLATDTACLGTENGHRACLNGGEIKKIVVSNTLLATACSDITNISDALDVFDWVCVDEVLPTIYSVGLKAGKSLKDLVDADSWKTNSVNIVGLITETSISSKWWTNPVVQLPINQNSNSNAITLDGVDDDGVGNDDVYVAGTIFTLTGDIASSGYNLNLDKIAVVVLNGASLSYSGNLDFNVGDTGESTGSKTTRALISAGGQKFLWIEGEFKTDYDALFLYGTHFTRFINVTTEGSAGINRSLYLNASHNSTLKNFKSDGYSSGIRLLNSNFNMGQEIHLANHTGYALELESSSSNTFAQIITSNSKGGVTEASTTPLPNDNVYSNILAVNHTEYGMVVHNRATLTQISSFQNGIGGVRVKESSPILHQVATLGNGTVANSGHGLRIESANGTFGQLALANNLKHGLYFSGSSTSNNKFTALMLFGNETDCKFNPSFPPINPGMDEDCVNQGTSDATALGNYDFSGTFIGKLTSPNDNVPYATIEDWISYNAINQTWGFTKIEDSIFGGNIGRCGTSNNCALFDWTIKLADTVLRERSGTGTIANSPFIDGNNCPDEVEGTQWIESKTFSFSNMTPHKSNGFLAAGSALACTAGSVCVQRYLKNAVEIINDGIGDDDGLCELSEACLYTPNIGAYQGEGLLGTCTFQDGGGLVTGVQMSGYLTNGKNP